MQSSIIGLAGALLAGGLTLPAAQAHPHAWIDAATTTHFNADGQVHAFTVHWTFDPIYSNYAIEGRDRDDDGNLSAEELRPLATQNLKALKDYRYFTDLRADGEDLAYGEVEDYSAAWENGRLGMTFTIPLKAPVTPGRQTLQYALYDPSFYVEILHREEDAIRLDGPAPSTCGMNLQKPDMNQAVSLSEMNFDNPPEDANYGRMFSEKVTLLCD